LDNVAVEETGFDFEEFGLHRVTQGCWEMKEKMNEYGNMKISGSKR
jgi:hypothetical protein